MTSEEFIRDRPRLGFVSTVRLLNKHGLGLDTPTAFWPEENRPDPDSTFRQEFGVRDWYDSAEVFAWLGY